MNRRGSQRKISTKQGVVQQTEVRIAPIPSPEDLSKYEEINPGFAERILKMAEKEQQYRNQREDRKIEVLNEADKRSFKLNLSSIFISLLVVGLCLTLAYLALTLGHSEVAYCILGSLAAIIGYLTFQRGNKGK